MATPVIMAIAAITQAASTVYNGVETAKAKKRQAKQVELNANHNAQVLRNKAEQERLDHQVNSREERRQRRARQEAIKGGVAKSGLMMEGTPTKTLLDQVSVDEASIYDNDRISAMKRKNFELNSQNVLIQGNNTAKNLRSQARSSLISAGIGAAGHAFSAYGALNAPVPGSGGTTKSPVTNNGTVKVPTPYFINSANDYNIKLNGVK